MTSKSPVTQRSTDQRKSPSPLPKATSKRFYNREASADGQLRVRGQTLVNLTPITLNLSIKGMRLSTIDCFVPFLTDVPLSKSALAQSLRVSRNTVKSWHSIAYLMLISYREQFPLSHNAFPPIRNQEVPFSPYQCWVLARIGGAMKVYRRSDFTKMYVANNQHLFSLAKFQSQIKGVA